MPTSRAVRVPTLLAVFAVCALGGCAWDGPASGVEVVMPGTLPPHDQAVVTGGTGVDVALEEQPADAGDVDGQAASPAVTLADGSDVTLPSPRDLPVDMPRTAAVVGDSLTLSAQEEIASYLEAIGVDPLSIDGAENRRMVHGSTPTPGVEVVSGLAAVTEPELWVIALGTNDVGAESSTARFGQDVQAVLAAIPEGVPVVWVDVWIRDRKEQSSAANQVLRDLVAERPDTVIVDWYAHGDDAGLIADDGVHLTADGQHVFAADIAAATVDLFDN